jgi:hypothetical protein
MIAPREWVCYHFATQLHDTRLWARFKPENIDYAVRDGTSWDCRSRITKPLLYH